MPSGTGVSPATHYTGLVDANTPVSSHAQVANVHAANNFNAMSRSMFNTNTPVTLSTSENFGDAHSSYQS